MRLKDVSRRFDKTPCRDAYSGAVLFNGQMAPWMEVLRDAVTYERRVLSVRPGINMPTRRALQAAGSNWIVGSKNIDLWLGEEIRHGYTLQEASVLARLLTLEEALAGATGTQAYCGRAWIKDEAFTQQSSAVVAQFEVFMGVNESAPSGSLIDFGGDLLVVHSSHTTEAQMLRATCESLGTAASSTASVTHGVWNPVTEQLSGSAVTIPVIRMRWQSLYAYGSPSAPRMEADDQQMVMSATSVPKPVGAVVQFSDSSRWSVRSATRYGSAWLCRATHHA